MKWVDELLGWKNFLGSLTGIFNSWDAFFGGIIEAWTEWNRSRRWWLIYTSSPVALGLLFIISTLTFYRLQSRDQFAQALLVRIDEKINFEKTMQQSFQSHLVRNGLKHSPANSPSGDSLSPDVSLTPSVISEIDEKRLHEAELLLERAKIESPGNIQLQLRKALIAVKRGDTALADTIMQELAENTTNIFPPAHAWTAISMLGTPSEQSARDSDVLEDRLRNAVTWKAVDPILFTVYSTMLLKSGRIEKSIQMAKQAADLRPELNLPYAQILKYAGPNYEKEMLKAAKIAEASLRAKLGSLNETEADRINAAKAILLTDRQDVAMEVLREGMGTKETPKKEVRRFLADLCVDEYRKANIGWIANTTVDKVAKGSKGIDQPAEPEKQSASESTTKPELNWSRLIEAAEVDPNNPSLGREIAYQLCNRQTIPSELNAILLKQLKNGTASTVCRLLIAQRSLEQGKISEARRLWEQIIVTDPTCLQALNNLSVMLSRDQPPNGKRALELIAIAYRLYPRNADICDSYGEIYMNLGRAKEAVSKYEEAIRIAPERIESRKKLSSCYQESGLKEMAVEQEKIIAKALALQKSEIKQPIPSPPRSNESTAPAPALAPAPAARR